MTGKAVLPEGRNGTEDAVAALGQNAAELIAGGLGAVIQADDDLIAAVRGTKRQGAVDMGLLGFQKGKAGGELERYTGGGDAGGFDTEHKDYLP